MPTLTTKQGLGLVFDEKQYRLATHGESIAGEGVIPPCDEGFTYCIYRKKSDFADSTFLSAGLRVLERADLTDRATCLSTPPKGYESIKPIVRDRAGSPGTSAFAPLGGAAAGHSVWGALYRLSFGTSCYEFEARVGASQYANYEPGTIQEFTREQQETVFAELIDVLNATTIDEGKTHVVYPAIDL